MLSLSKSKRLRNVICHTPPKKRFIINIQNFHIFTLFLRPSNPIMKSMTGFGKARSANDKRKITVEIRTLNSKQADLTIKAPNIYKDREAEIRNELINMLQRGKIELSITQ